MVENYKPEFRSFANFYFNNLINTCILRDMQTKNKLDTLSELPEVVSPDDEDVLSYTRRYAYEIRPKRLDYRILRHYGFTSDGDGRWYTHSARTVKCVPEWELLADPETYARLKTQTA